MEISDLNPDPILEFEKWFKLAEETDLPHPNAMTLATTTSDGKPSSRVVLLKTVDARGFVFYTNFESRKGRELAQNPCAALVFHWDILRRQIRIEGNVERTVGEQSKTYFQSRPRDSQLAAWISEQSAVIENRAVLEEKMAKLEEKYTNQAIPVPPFWGGYRVIPDEIEFWLEAPRRLHDRFRYRKPDLSRWSIQRLSP